MTPSSDKLKRFEEFLAGTYRATARHINSVYLAEVFQRNTVWEFEVEVFELSDHPNGKHCYLWEGADHKLVAVFESPNVQNAADAVESYLKETSHTPPSPIKQNI